MLSSSGWADSASKRWVNSSISSLTPASSSILPVVGVQMMSILKRGSAGSVALLIVILEVLPKTMMMVDISEVKRDEGFQGLFMGKRQIDA